MSYIYNIRDDGKTDEPISDSLVIKRLMKEGVSALVLTSRATTLSFCRNGQAMLYSYALSMRGSGGLLSLAVFISDRAALPRYGEQQRPTDVNSSGHALQKGGVPAAPSGTATLLRLSPSHLSYPWPLLAVTDFRHSRLPWLDGRCVQGPGTYSPRHG